MRITFLGTGTSHGIPVIGCECSVCQSDDPRNKRTRSSLWVQQDGVSILIDTATEFRLQALRANIQAVDAVLYTHCHADHVFGFDDLRIFSQKSGQPVRIYGNYATLAEMHQVFNYVFRKTQLGGGKPQVETIIADQEFSVLAIPILPISVYHGQLGIYGYRIGSVAYITDCSYIPKRSQLALQGLDVLILGVIRREPHQTHLHIDGALEIVNKLQPGRVYFTHISHRLEHTMVNCTLPSGIELAYDGLELTI